MLVFRKFAKRILIAGIFFFAALAPRPASAFGVDLLGELAQPLIGPAKEKMKGMLVYVWLQPYAGYATGSSNQSRTHTGGAVTTTANGLKTDGFFMAAEGGSCCSNPCG